MQSLSAISDCRKAKPVRNAFSLPPSKIRRLATSPPFLCRGCVVQNSFGHSPEATRHNDIPIFLQTAALQLCKFALDIVAKISFQNGHTKFWGNHVRKYR